MNTLKYNFPLILFVKNAGGKKPDYGKDMDVSVPYVLIG